MVDVEIKEIKIDVVDEILDKMGRGWFTTSDVFKTTGLSRCRVLNALKKMYDDDQVVKSVRCRNLSRGRVREYLFKIK